MASIAGVRISVSPSIDVIERDCLLLAHDDLPFAKSPSDHAIRAGRIDFSYHTSIRRGKIHLKIPDASALQINDCSGSENRLV